MSIQAIQLFSMISLYLFYGIIWRIVSIIDNVESKHMSLNKSGIIIWQIQRIKTH